MNGQHGPGNTNNRHNPGEKDEEERQEAEK